MTAPAPAVPRTMVRVCAAVDGVALRIDQAGVTPDRVINLTVMSAGGLRVDVLLRDRPAFDAVLELYPTHTRRDDASYLRARVQSRDGSTVDLAVLAADPVGGAS